jgi:hypothetical protein
VTPRPRPARGGALPADLAAALAAHGIAPGPAGHDAAALVAWVEALAGTGPHSPPGHARYRALVWWPTEYRQPDLAYPVAGHGSARGRGRTAAEALAKALLAWLDRDARAAEGVR